MTDSVFLEPLIQRWKADMQICKGQNGSLHQFAVLGLDKFFCVGLDSFVALASVIEHPLEELLFPQLRLHQLMWEEEYNHQQYKKKITGWAKKNPGAFTK